MEPLEHLKEIEFCSSWCRGCCFFLVFEPQQGSEQPKIQLLTHLSLGECHHLIWCPVSPIPQSEGIIAQ